MTGAATRTVRLVFVDQGSYHREDVDVPIEALGRHERLLDVLQEDPGILRRIHVDMGRLCAAYIVDGS